MKLRTITKLVAIAGAVIVWMAAQNSPLHASPPPSARVAVGTVVVQ